MRGKEKWVQLLCAAGDAEGNHVKNKDRAVWRNSLVLVGADAYRSDPAQWRTAAKKEMKSQTIFKEFVTGLEVPKNGSKVGQVRVYPIYENLT
jgi:hypothetical protein